MLARYHATTSVAKFDRLYDPDGDGVLSVKEIKAWGPINSPPPVANNLQRFDNSGNLARPIIIGQGSHRGRADSRPGRCGQDRLIRSVLRANAATSAPVAANLFVSVLRVGSGPSTAEGRRSAKGTLSAPSPDAMRLRHQVRCALVGETECQGSRLRWAYAGQNALNWRPDYAEIVEPVGMAPDS